MSDYKFRCFRLEGDYRIIIKDGRRDQYIRYFFWLFCQPA
jgi:hypothetical protein